MGGADDGGPPEPPGPKRPLQGVILRIAEASGGTEVTIDKGKGDGVRTGVRGDIMDPRGRPLAGGRVVVTKIFERSCKAEVGGLSADAIPDSANVVLMVPQ